MKTNKRTIIVLLTLLLTGLIPTNAQEPRSSDLPQIIPPSPEARALFKYVDHPVNYATGIPDITIPIHTIEAGPITLPISISYHSGGRKIDDVTGAIGLGWTLNIGGMVSRTIFGHDDLEYPVPANLKSASDIRSMEYTARLGYEEQEGYSQAYKYLAGIYYKFSQGPSGYYGQSMDGEYDVFSFCTTNSSGKFVLDHNKYPKLITKTPVKIDFTGSTAVVTEPSGVKYSFLSQDYPRTDYHLTKISSPDGKHTINFSYQGGRLETTSGGYEAKSSLVTMEVTDYAYKVPNSGGVLTSPGRTSYVTSTPEKSYGCQRVSEIDFGHGKIVFTMETTGGKIKEIKVINAQGAVVKTIQLSHSFLDKVAYTNYKLDKLTITNGSLKAEEYVFDYYPSSNAHITCYDFWGYKNGHTYISGDRMFPRFQIECMGGGYNTTPVWVGYGNTYRQPSEAIMKEGMLYKITYPTGGNTQYEYEKNAGNCGGLHVKKITTNDGSGNLITKSYEYSAGRIPVYQAIEYSADEQINLVYTGDMSRYDSGSFSKFTRVRRFTSSPQADMGYAASAPVFFGTVTEVLGNGTNIIGKTTYKYTDPYNSIGVRMPPYPNSNTTSKQVDYMIPMPTDNLRRSKYISMESYLWLNGNLEEKSDYKYNSSTQKYELAKTVKYEYDRVESETLRGLKVWKYLNFPNWQNEKTGAIREGWSVFLYDDYQISCGIELLKSTTEVEYRDNTAITTKQEYTYNTKNLQKTVTTVNSNNTSTIQETKYPFDDEYKNSDPYKKMLTLNMMNFPVKTTTTTGAATESTTTTYKEWASNQVMPEFIKVKTGTTEDTRIKYHNYDTYGNPVYITKDDDTKVVYLWSYKGKYPIAEITNATFTNVEAAVKSVFAVTNIDALAQQLTPNETKLKDGSLQKALPGALVTTYTYKPLVGMLSVTNPQGISTYFQYDGFSRLEQIYQMNGSSKEILESYQYNYKR
ncbi:hypothetical protein [Bacteroides sp. 519]|uniref:hypothetical protein n=1 Tax=Bacteroides sp. 519 TaxID=2302937 RepID=UPI0013D8792E|nr:hypothetical protein [Bacteroides sp. 519]